MCTLKTLPEVVPAKLRDELLDLIYTEFQETYFGKEEKTKRMAAACARFGFEFSEHGVKVIIYNIYVSSGGWRTFEEFTGWMFKN